MNKEYVQEGGFHLPSRWGSQNYLNSLSEHVRTIDSPNKTRKRVNYRRLSQEYDDTTSTEKKSNFHVIGNSNSKFTDDKRNQITSHLFLQQKGQIEPFKIKDFIPSINPQIKSELIKLNKNNFLDFLLVQKVGRTGDQQFFDALIHQYNFDPYKKSLSTKKENEKPRLSYLSKRDEGDDIIEKQVKQLYRSLKQKKKSSQDPPLDQLIIQKNQYLIQRLPKFKAKLDALQPLQRNK